jgi:hypothetical protein
MSALQRTYGFTPLVLTTSAPGTEITNGIPFCRIRSLITGKRMVSLPFSDHCQPLSAPEELFGVLQETCRDENLKYIELRPLEALTESGLSCSQRYWFHLLDLRPPLEEIVRKFHQDCVRRKIRRAEREGLEVEAGRSDALLAEFYALHISTRRKHGLPPQPRKWFRNLLDEMDRKSMIRVARFKGRAVAAILTLQHNRTAVYKYGASDPSENNRGGMQKLLWTTIEDAKKQGMEWMDLGRCDEGDESLAEFKERWGAERKEIAYYRYPACQMKTVAKPNSLMRHLPYPVLVAAGRLLYRHMA